MVGSSHTYRGYSKMVWGSNNLSSGGDLNSPAKELLYILLGDRANPPLPSHVSFYF